METRSPDSHNTEEGKNMERILSKVAVTLCVVVFLSAPWAMFLGAEGMELFWASMLCGMALYVTARRDFVSSPWSIVVGMLLSWWLLGTGFHLLPEEHAFRNGTDQLGLSLHDMTRVRDVSFLSTVCFFLLRGLVAQRQLSEKRKQAEARRCRAVRIPPETRGIN